MARIPKSKVYNPQKAEAYVGKRVLQNGDTLTAIKGSFTPVPNGPLVKKKGVFKGSTLKNGGNMAKVKKAQTGRTIDSLINVVKTKPNTDASMRASGMYAGMSDKSTPKQVFKMAGARFVEGAKGLKNAVTGKQKNGGKTSKGCMSCGGKMKKK